MRHIMRPVEAPFKPDIEEVLATYPRRDEYLLSIFRVFANSVRFLKKGVANLLDKDSPLSIHQREMIILRVTANLDCEYEWGVHVAAFSKAANLSDAQVHASRHSDHTANCWAPAEQTLILLVDQLCATGTITDSTRQRMQDIWSPEEQLEILALCGNYHTVCFVANVAQVENELFGVSFPAP
jgi:alkylhydroperoxidase family enzyme